MAPIAMVFGVLLTLLGGGMYVYTSMVSITALIPAFFGIPLFVLGVLARNEKFRMHAMHGAALIGLVGFAIPTYMVVKGLIAGDEFGLAKGEQTAMAVMCLVFVALCVKSFIDARVARKAKEAAATPTN
ncbi:MAG TPA: hypothetical protein VFE62_23260 [Gemmataceae bacterium]|nr:hypothetical protein [Gemmataceae bacterium]